MWLDCSRADHPATLLPPSVKFRFQVCLTAFSDFDKCQSGCKCASNHLSRREPVVAFPVQGCEILRRTVNLNVPAAFFKQSLPTAGPFLARNCIALMSHRARSKPSSRQCAGLGGARRLRSRQQPSQHHVCARAQGEVVLVDNYDSFTYNLSQYLGSLGCQHRVIKNDELTIEELQALKPRGILVSPGPGAPEDSGISLAICAQLGPHIPLFGVCMGHQCIGQAFGGKVIRAPTGLMHGKGSKVHHTNVGVLENMPRPFAAARYHSLVIDGNHIPDCLEVTAWTEDETVMGVRHKEHHHIQGVQFHPESIITDTGLHICENWVKSL